MYRKLLPQELIDDGEKLLQKLEKGRFPITAALWYYQHEDEPWYSRSGEARWRLFIASRTVDTRGPLDAYARIQKALGEMGRVAFALEDLSVVSPASIQFQELRQAIGMSRVASPEKAHEGTFADAIVYRWPTRRAVPRP